MHCPLGDDGLPGSFGWGFPGLQARRVHGYFEGSNVEQEIKRHYAFFSPNYRKLATVPLTDFSWLTPDHLVQKTEFGDEASVVANFSAAEYRYQGHAVPSTGVLLVWKKTGQAVAYASQYAGRRTTPAKGPE